MAKNDDILAQESAEVDDGETAVVKDDHGRRNLSAKLHEKILKTVNFKRSDIKPKKRYKLKKGMGGRTFRGPAPKRRNGNA